MCLFKNKCVCLKTNVFDFKQMNYILIHHPTMVLCFVVSPCSILFVQPTLWEISILTIRKHLICCYKFAWIRTISSISCSSLQATFYALAAPRALYSIISSAILAMALHATTLLVIACHCELFCTRHIATLLQAFLCAAPLALSHH